MRIGIGTFLTLLLCLGVTPSSAQSNVKITSLNFTSIEVPGADVTFVNGINAAGDMVGNYLTGTQPFGAFLLCGGNFTFFRYNNISTSAQGINDSGVMVGWIGADE
jgi:hypothetical protein